MPLNIWDEEDGQGSLFMELKVRHVRMPIFWRSTNINTDQEKDTKLAPFSWTANNVQEEIQTCPMHDSSRWRGNWRIFSAGYSTMKWKGSLLLRIFRSLINVILTTVAIVKFAQMDSDVDKIKTHMTFMQHWAWQKIGKSKDQFVVPEPRVRKRSKMTCSSLSVRALPAPETKI